MSQTPEDPFAGGVKTPAVSFKGAPIGATVVLKVTEFPKFLQSKNFETQELDFWPPNSDGTRNPKMAAVVVGTVDGEPRSIWATKPSSLFAAIAEAQVKSGRLQPGSTLTVRLEAEVPFTDPKKKHLNPKKEYSATITQPSPDDPFVREAAAQPATQVSAQQATSSSPWSPTATDSAGSPPF